MRAPTDLIGRLRGGHERVVRLRSTQPRPWGRALLSYLSAPAAWSEGDRRLRGHTNKWESREIAMTLCELGLDVDVIDFDDEVQDLPSRSYDVVLGIHSALHRLAERTGARTRLLHLTGSYPPFQNAAELRRLDELEERRGVRCEARRLVADAAGFDQVLADADACSLLGNEWTLSTFPQRFHAKITCVPVTGSQLTRVQTDGRVPREREFIWFFGAGAIHKGLDRALEAFSRNPGLVLNVVGNIGGEQDFVRAYRRELTELPNIRWHGFVDPASRQFRRLARRCFCVVAPTCSEAISAATVTMLQLGLYPLISHESGVTLPTGAGRYLETCSVDEIEAAAADLHSKDERGLATEMTIVQGVALEAYSRERFRSRIRAHLQRALSGKDAGQPS